MTKIKEKRSLLILCSIVVIGLLLRFVLLGNTDFYFDEAMWAHQARVLVEDNISTWDFLMGEQPPVFTWLNAISVGILGLGEFSGRLVSALLGTAIIVLTYLLAREYYSRRVALLASLIISLMPLHVLYSRSAHSDVTVGFFVLLSIYILERGRNNENRIFPYLMGGLTFSVAFLTKYSAVVIWALYWFFVFAFSLRKRSRLPIREFSVSHLSAFLGILIISHFSIKNLFFVAYNVVTWSFAQSVDKTFPFYYYFSVLFDGLSPFLFAVFVVALGYYLWHAKYQNRDDTQLAFIVLTFMLILFLQSRRFPRNFVIILPLISIFVARYVMEVRNKKAYALIAFVAITTLGFSVYEISKIEGFHLWSDTGDYLYENVEPNSTIHVAYANQWPLKYYIGDEFANFYWGRHYDRGVHINVRTNDRLDQTLIMEGDYVVVADFANRLGGVSPLETDVPFFNTQPSLYPQGYVDYVKSKGTLEKSFSDGKHSVEVYKIISATDGEFYLPAPPGPSSLICAFRRFMYLIPQELQHKLSSC